jgi:DNA-directed RNA polymerase subunit L
MQVKLVEKGHDFLRLSLPKGAETILVPLVEGLQAEEAVVEARYYIGHPFAEDPGLYLKTKGEKPQAVLKRVLKSLSDNYSDVLVRFDKVAEKQRS